MKHDWKVAFKGYQSGKLVEITYSCKSCPTYHSKTVPPEDKFNLEVTGEKKVAGAWTRNKNIEREKFSKDIAQPFKKDGTVNEKFLKAYGPETYKNWGVSNPQPHQKKYL
jgi:hypothetical protein